MATYKTTPTRITTTTQTTVYTAPAGGTSGISVRIVAGGNTTAGNIKIELNQGSDRTYTWVPVPATTAATDGYFTITVALPAAVLASGDLIKVTLHESATYDIFVNCYEL